MRVDPRRPLVQVFLLYAIVIAAAALAGRGWIAIVLFASLAFAVVNPLTCALRHAWWVDTLVSGVGFAGMFVLCEVLESMGMLRLGEDSMALLGPVMLYMVALPVSGLLRLARYRRARAAAASPPPV